MNNFWQKYPQISSWVLEDFILNNQWVASVHRFSVVNPATDDHLVDISIASPQHAQQAVDFAQVAFEKWKREPVKKRAALLRKWFDLIIQHQHELALLLTIEQGKPLVEARAEVLYCASYVEWFAEEAKRIEGDLLPEATSDKRMWVSKEPVGVCVAITPWNFPFAMVTRKLAPALAAGCSVILKPAEQTPMCALALGKLAIEAGFPPGVLQILTSDTKGSVEIGKVLCEDERVRKLSFTGSTEVGRILMAQCAPSLKRLSLELGGHAPFIVFDDADINEAVLGAMASKYRNAGQTCVCANRFFVHHKVYDAFVEALAKASAELKIGNGLDDGVQQGPLIDDLAIQKVQIHVNDAITKGAICVTGGEAVEINQVKRFFMPTVLSQVNPDMLVMKEETFGPVCAVMSFDTEEEAVNLANETPYGLAAYFYTKDIHRMFRVSENLTYGMVGVNTGAFSSEMAPFGGVKQSGFGREGSRYGIEEYLEKKFICLGGF
jgi:succinate-semialdehyde dehydrogenase/glutarate-semialdehyde dehydrogenase